MESTPLSRSDLQNLLNSRWAMTDIDGLANGTTLIDDHLIGENPWMVGKTILIMGGASSGAQFMESVITAFDDATGELTVSPAFLDGAGNPIQILALTIYAITNFSGGSSIALIKTQINNLPTRITQPASAYTAQIVLTTGAANKALGSITIAGIPTGWTVAHLFMHVKFGGRENTHATLVNSISGAQNIQAKKDAGAFSTGIALAGGEYSTPAASLASGDVIMGTTDLVTLAVVNGSVVTFQWTSALSAQNNFNINDIQVVLELYAKPS